MATLVKELAEIVGSGGVVSSDRLGDYTVDGLMPTAAVSPSTVDEVAQVLAVASGEGWKVTPWGGGTQMALGNRPRGLDLVLGLARLDSLLAHEPADLTATVEGGVTLAALQEKLAGKGQFLPIQAPLPSKATVGGILATNASGPSRLAYGIVRDWLIGVRVVLADGTVTKSGGRVVKNVTGYDLNKLYIGSLGTLGVIVEATFKLAPLPAHRTTLVAGYPSLNAALDAAQATQSQHICPHAVHVLTRRVAVGLPPLEPFHSEAATVAVLFEGRPSAVARKEQESAATLKRHGAVRVECLASQESDALWQGITDLGWARREDVKLALKLVAPPAAIATLLHSVAGSYYGPAPVAVVVDPGYGMARLFWRQGQDPYLDAYRVEQMVASLRAAASPMGGYVTIERCPSPVKEQLDVWGGPAEGLQVMRRIKDNLDPAGVLNSGRFVGRL